MEAGIASLVLNIVLAIIMLFGRRDRNQFRLEYERFKAETEREQRDDNLMAQTIQIVPETVRLFAAQTTVLEEISSILRGSSDRHSNTVHAVQEAAAAAIKQRQSIQATQSEMHRTLQGIPAATERALHPSFKQVPPETGDLILPRLQEMQAALLAAIDKMQARIVSYFNPGAENMLETIKRDMSACKADCALRLAEIQQELKRIVPPDPPPDAPLSKDTKPLPGQGAKDEPTESDEWTDAAEDAA